MTRISSIGFFCCLLFSSVFAQTRDCTLVSEQNNIWLDSLKKISLDRKLLMINDRLRSDINLFEHKTETIDSLDYKVYDDCSPTLIVGGNVITIDSKTRTKKVVSLTKLLTPTYIQTIYIISPNDLAALVLCEGGRSGIIAMTTTKKKYIRQFTRLE